MAWRLLHPLARFRAGVGSMDKFIEKIDFGQKTRFDLGLLPHFDEYRHLINYGPPHFEDPRIAHDYMIRHARYCECASKIWPRRSLGRSIMQEVFGRTDVEDPCDVHTSLSPEGGNQGTIPSGWPGSGLQGNLQVKVSMKTSFTL